MKAVGLCACSNGQAPEAATRHAQLVRYLEALGCRVQQSRCIFAENGAFSGSGAERAAELMKLFAEPSIEEIYDVSGGDVANQILPYLDWDVIRRSKAVFWGYSDLTTILNAIYAKTGKPVSSIRSAIWSVGIFRQCSSIVLPIETLCFPRRSALCRVLPWKASWSAAIFAAF